MPPLPEPGAEALQHSQKLNHLIHQEIADASGWISFARFMELALEGRPITDFEIPTDVTFVNIDKTTGLRAVPGRASVLEVFRRGSEPLRYPVVQSPEPGQPDWDYLDDGEVPPGEETGPGRYTY